MVRSCRRYSRLLPDSNGVVREASWIERFACPGAKHLPGPHRFGSPQWSNPDADESVASSTDAPMFWVRGVPTCPDGAAMGAAFFKTTPFAVNPGATLQLPFTSSSVYGDSVRDSGNAFTVLRSGVYGIGLDCQVRSSVPAFLENFFVQIVEEVSGQVIAFWAFEDTGSGFDSFCPSWFSLRHFNAGDRLRWYAGNLGTVTVASFDFSNVGRQGFIFLVNLD